MDLSTVGRTRDDEQAVMEELSGAQPVGGTDRRWLLAIAGIAAVVCFGFVSSAVSPPTTPDKRPAIEAPRTPSDSWPDPSNGLRRAQASPAAPIDLLEPAGGASVTGGQVRVSLRTTPQARVHIWVMVGDAVIGWRDVRTEQNGSWEGLLRVFAPRVALPAIVRAVALCPQGAIEAKASIVLEGGGQVVLWNATVVQRASGLPAVEYRASAPLSFTHVAAWVTDGTGQRLGKVASASRLEEWQPGSAGAFDLGLGTVSGDIQLRGRPAGQLVLHLAWRDPITSASGALQHRVQASGDAQP